MPTREERELEEIKNAPKFHANPLDPRIVEGHGQIGIPRQPKKELTQPIVWAFLLILFFQ